MWEIPTLALLGLFCVAAAIFLGFRIVGRLRGLPFSKVLLTVGVGIVAALFGITVLRLFNAQIREISPALVAFRDNYFLAYFIVGAYFFPMLMGFVAGYLVRGKLPWQAVLNTALLIPTFIIFQPLGQALLLWLFNRGPG